MRRIRFVALGIVSFVVSIFGALLAPGTFLNRALSAALCTVFSFNSAVCTASLVQSSERVVAATPPAVERSIADISGYLQAQRDPSEFGDEQPSAPSPGSNPQAPPFPQDPGPNFPVRREFDNPDSKPTNISPPQSRTATPDSPIFKISYKQMSRDTIEVALISAEGCNFNTTIKKRNNQVIEELMKFTPSSAEVCGSEAFSAHLDPDTKSLKVEMDNSQEALTYQILNTNSVQVTYQKSTGQTETKLIPIPQNLQRSLQSKGLGKDVDELACNMAKLGCDALSVLGAVSAGGTLLTLAAGGPVTLTAGAAIGAFGFLMCFIMFGGVPPLPGLGQGQKIISALSQGVSSGISIAEGARTGIETAAQGGLSFNSYCGGLTPPAGQFSPWFNMNDPTLTSVRKTLGIDACAKYCNQPSQPQQTAQQPNLTRRPCRVPKEFFKDKRVVAGIRMDDYICVIREPVITDGGIVDGVTACGTCDIWGNFGLPPTKSSCNSRAIDSDRSNQVPTCPSNWYGGN